jgi:hypothetical protein
MLLIVQCQADQFELTTLLNCGAMTINPDMRRFLIGASLAIQLFFARGAACELPSVWARAEGQPSTLTANGTIAAVDRRYSRVFLYCRKPFWAPGPNASTQIILWPTQVALAVAIKGTAIKLDGKKAGFDQLAKGQEVVLQYCLERSYIGNFPGVHCVALRMDLRTPSAPKK